MLVLIVVPFLDEQEYLPDMLAIAGCAGATTRPPAAGRRWLERRLAPTQAAAFAAAHSWATRAAPPAPAAGARPDGPRARAARVSVGARSGRRALGRRGEARRRRAHDTGPGRRARAALRRRPATRNRRRRISQDQRRMPGSAVPTATSRARPCFYRRECWDAIAPLPPIIGWDTMDEVRARMHGWRTETFSMPAGDPVHLRKMGSHDGTAARLPACRAGRLRLWSAPRTCPGRRGRADARAAAAARRRQLLRRMGAGAVRRRRRAPSPSFAGRCGARTSRGSGLCAPRSTPRERPRPRPRRGASVPVRRARARAGGRSARGRLPGHRRGPDRVRALGRRGAPRRRARTAVRGRAERRCGAVGYVREYATAWLALRRIARRVHREDPFDLVLVCNPPDALSLITRPSRRRGVKVVFDYREICPELYEAKFMRRGLAAPAPARERAVRPAVRRRGADGQRRLRAARTASGAVSSASRIYLVGNGPDPDRIYAVAPGPSCAEAAGTWCCGSAPCRTQEGLGAADRRGPRRRPQARAQGRAVRPRRSGRRPRRSPAGGRTARSRGLRRRSRGRSTTTSCAPTCPPPTCASASTSRAPMNDRAAMRKVLEYMAVGRPVVQFPLDQMREALRRRRRIRPRRATRPTSPTAWPSCCSTNRGVRRSAPPPWRASSRA